MKNGRLAREILLLSLLVLLAGCGSSDSDGVNIADCSVPDRCVVEIGAAQLAELDASRRDADGDGQADFDQIASIVAAATAQFCLVASSPPECFAYPACGSPTSCDRSQEARAGAVRGSLRVLADSGSAVLRMEDTTDRFVIGGRSYRLSVCRSDELLALLAATVPEALRFDRAVRDTCSP